MTSALIYGYLGTWLVSTIAVAFAARRLQDEQQPATHPVLLSVVAGAVWPVLLIAAAEAGFLALSQEVLHAEEPVLTVAV